MFKDWKRKKLAKRTARVARTITQLQAELNQLDEKTRSLNGQIASKPVQRWELWTSFVGVIVVAIALGLAAWSFVAYSPEDGWAREQADLIGAAFVGFAVVLQGITAMWDQWGADAKRASGWVSAVAVWASFVGAALVLVAIVNPGG
ncbi:hypothetical protein Csp2054_09035 [Curtobacterium sp. 'Ferrero']|uniref:hypothetical protein n=1 Tax=Curtobacterium sp. 'Ferrero' TaxID=2033654 RepID=UPI000BD96131|nr:hypothetical protein [Curtobacterium sp. 'Ferrero']PCN48007.1 hypothetical protein Csp2054_09035 [Curtobacterium sp. 'Ferrero']